MRVLLHTEFAANRKEPLVEMFERLRAAFHRAGLGEPRVQFSFSDAPLHGHVSSVDRVLKRYPAMQRFCTESALVPTLSPARRITNQNLSGETADVDVLRVIVTGVPKSFPFHNVVLAFAATAFGEGSYRGILEMWLRVCLLAIRGG